MAGIGIIEIVLVCICLVSVLFFIAPKDAIRLRKNKHRPLRSKGNELGSGDLAGQKHIDKWTTSTDALDTKLAVKGLRGSNGAGMKKGDLVIPRGERNRHILIIAKTGSGKTTKLILPVLHSDCMCKTRSTIVIDSKPEMWDKLAAMTNHYNPEKEIMLFNALDTVRSLSWNILAKVESDSDAKLIANSIIMATDNPNSKSDSPFFRNNALSLLNAIFVGLLNDPNERISMPRAHELVHAGMQNLCDWLEAHPSAIRNSRTFVELARSGSQNADTIMSELGMRLAAWDLKAIRSTTFAEELNLDALVEKPSLLIVELRESEMEMLRPLANVIVVEILRFLTKRAESCPGHSLPRPVSLVIDEFASALGRLPDIHVKLNTLRSRNVSIVAAIQSIAQIKANYKEDADSVLAGFSTKILMPALDFQDSEWASKETGQMTVRFATKRQGTNKKITEFLANRSVDKTEQVQQRAVLTPDEIGRPVDDISTFFMPNTPVFQGHMIPFYEQPEMLEQFNKFDGQEFNLREKPIEYEEKMPEPSTAASTVSPQQAQNMSPEEIQNLLEEVKTKLDWENTTGAAREWWVAFEKENSDNTYLVYRLAQELEKREATITEFFLAYVYSNSDSIEENLKFLEQMKAEQKNEAAAQEQAPTESLEPTHAFGGGGEFDTPVPESELHGEEGFSHAEDAFGYQATNGYDPSGSQAADSSDQSATSMALASVFGADNDPTANGFYQNGAQAYGDGRGEAGSDPMSSDPFGEQFASEQFAAEQIQTNHLDVGHLDSGHMHAGHVEPRHMVNGHMDNHSEAELHSEAESHGFGHDAAGSSFDGIGSSYRELESYSADSPEPNGYHLKQNHATNAHIEPEGFGDHSAYGQETHSMHENTQIEPTAAEHSSHVADHQYVAPQTAQAREPEVQGEVTNREDHQSQAATTAATTSPPQAVQPVPPRSKLEIVRALQDKKRVVGWSSTSDVTKQWWEAFEKANRQNLEIVLNVVEGLEQRGRTISDFYTAYGQSQAASINEVFQFIDRNS